MKDKMAISKRVRQVREELKGDPDNIDLQLDLVRFFIDGAEFEEGIKQLKQVISRNKKNNDKKYDKEIQVLKKILLKSLNQLFWGSDRDSFFTRKHSRPSGKHGGTGEELSFLRGYFPCGYISDENGDWATTGVWKNKDFLRLRDVVMHLAAPQPGKVILDIGCANGAMMIYAGLQGAEVYGQDHGEGEVTTANECLDRFQIKGEAKLGDIVNLKFPDNFFDVIISSDFYEHITDEVKTQSLREALRVLKPGGIIVIRTPNLAYLKISLLYKRIIAVSRFQNPLALSIPDTTGPSPGHVGLTKRKELSRCLINAGFHNYQFFYAPLRRFGFNYMIEILSTEIPVIRDLLCEDLIVRAYKPIGLSHFPE